jgi:pyruvate kinase
MSRTLRGKRTKIVATIGPSSDNADILKKMIRAGLDVVRINFSHITAERYPYVAELIQTIRQLSQEEAKVIAIMADLQGPKIRLGELNPDPLPIQRGDTIIITSRKDYNQTKGEIPMPHPEVIQDVRVGHRLLIDDGDIEFRVKRATRTDLECEVVVGNELKSRKGVSVPNSSLSLSALTDKDQQDVKFALEQGVDYVAMSFVRNADDMRRLRFLVDHLHGDAGLIAKIEKAEAISAFDEILDYADGVMVARGDLGVEIPAAEVPVRQKEIIEKCNYAGKPVITATQMLSSMVNNPRPTRAEASDVANAIFDGTDAVMLSNETASGNFPLQAVETMAAIAEISEQHLYDSGKWQAGAGNDLSGVESIPDAISYATNQMARAIKAELIVSCTWTGYTARRVARERPATPILCITPNKLTYHQMALVWGVVPVLVEEFGNIDEMLTTVEEAALNGGYARMDDHLVIIGGVPFGAGGNTNFVKIHTIGEASTFRP